MFISYFDEESEFGVFQGDSPLDCHKRFARSSGIDLTAGGSFCKGDQELFRAPAETDKCKSYERLWAYLDIGFKEIEVFLKG